MHRKLTDALMAITEINRKRLECVLENEMIVLIHIHEFIEFGAVVQTNLDQPSFTVRILVNDRSMIVEMRIDR